jgi:hypothetical protein
MWRNTQMAGAPQIQLNGFSLDSSPKVRTGRIFEAADNWWGGGEFIYAKYGGTIRQFGVCIITPTWDSTLNIWDFVATEAPNTANLGKGLAIAQFAGSSGSYGWFQLSGVTPVNSSAAVAADTAFGIAAAGQAGAIANGKQILNARVIAASTTTVVKTGAFGNNGDSFFTVPNTDGWFPGIYLSGTGIGTNAVVNSVDPSSRVVTVSVANSAAVTGSITGTYNNGTVYYNIAQLNRPFAQGQIT